MTKLPKWTASRSLEKAASHFKQSLNLELAPNGITPSLCDRQTFQNYLDDCDEIFDGDASCYRDMLEICKHQ